MNRFTEFLLVFLVIILFNSAAQEGASGNIRTSPAGSSGTGLFLSQHAEGWFPRAFDSRSDLSSVLGTVSQISYSPFRFAQAFFRLGVYSLQFDSKDPLFYISGAAGLGVNVRLSPRVSLNGSGFAGLGKIPNTNIPGQEDQSYGLYELGGRLEATIRLTAALSLGVSAGYSRLATPAYSFLDGLTGGIRFQISPKELKRNNSYLDFEKIQTQAIFPVLRSWYDSEPLGMVTLRNGEDGPIENVRVSFFVPEYMGGARVSPVIRRMEQGEMVEVPLYAVFDERVLALTENVTTFASLNAEYSFYGSPRTAKQDLSVLFHHRNAMAWEDDRRAASFVSPTDPAALWFSRYASRIVRDRQRGDLPPNLQYALGIFEGLKLYGVNYVVDPNSAYVELSENALAVDYLQYPSETLMYRGGDCDDLTILYCSLLESSGISTAFITIPGHIYMAFDLGISEADARTQFFDPGLLIFRDGRAWAPVEITMVKEGFVKAWRIGAKQWIDNNRVGRADFFAMKENWATYKPSGLQNANARFDLPGETVMMASFDSAVDRFVLRELGPVIAEYESRLEKERDPEVLNEYGIVLARAGMLDEAWELFSEAAEEGYSWAWNNLASIAFVRKDYDLAYSYSNWAESLLERDPVAHLGIARAAYEMDLYARSGELYTELLAEAPLLAARFEYLASVYGGSGRAWSLADRLTATVWSKPGLNFKPEELAESPVTPAAVVEAEFPAAVAMAPPVEAAGPEAPAAKTPVSPAEDLNPVIPEPPAPAPAVTVAPVEEAEPPAAVALAPPVEAAGPEAPAVTLAPVEEAELPAAVAMAPPVEAAEPKAPPVIDREAPEDMEIADKVPEEGKVLPKPETVLAPVPVALPVTVEAASTPVETVKPAAPPVIQKSAPKDIEIEEKALEESIILPPEETVPVPAAPPVALAMAPPVETVKPAAPPAIEKSAPKDIEIEEKALEESIVLPPPKIPAQARIEPPVTFAPPPEAVANTPPVETVKPAAPPAAVVIAPPVETVQPDAPPAAVTAVPPVERPIPPEPVKSVINLTNPGIRMGTGKWELETLSAAMTDTRAMFAKLIIPAKPVAGPTVYEFTARSTGSYLAGFGIHIHGRGVWKLSSYGGGDSILVWITSDPAFYGDAAPRVQIYRSRNEVAMPLISSVGISGSVYDARLYRIQYDPVRGTLTVFVDGKSVLKTEGLENFPAYDYYALRALDSAEFSDLMVFPFNTDGSSAEASHE